MLALPALLLLLLRPACPLPCLLWRACCAPAALGPGSRSKLPAAPSAPAAAPYEPREEARVQVRPQRERCPNIAVPSSSGLYSTSPLFLCLQPSTLLPSHVARSLDAPRAGRQGQWKEEGPGDEGMARARQALHRNTAPCCCGPIAPPIVRRPAWDHCLSSSGSRASQAFERMCADVKAVLADARVVGAGVSQVRRLPTQPACLPGPRPAADAAIHCCLMEAPRVRACAVRRGEERLAPPCPSPSFPQACQHPSPSLRCALYDLCRPRA